MSEWKFVLKSTSIEKQVDMKAFLEGMKKVIEEAEKQNEATQPTTAQATPPTQATKPVQTQQQKPASGYKNYTSEEVQALKNAGINDKEIKRLDAARAKSSANIKNVRGQGLTPQPNVQVSSGAPQGLGQRAVAALQRTGQATGQKVRDWGAKQQAQAKTLSRAARGGTQTSTATGQTEYMPRPTPFKEMRSKIREVRDAPYPKETGQITDNWKDKLKPIAGQRPAATRTTTSPTEGRTVVGSYDKEGPSGFGVAAPPKQSISRTQTLPPAERRKRNIKGKQARQAGLGKPIGEGRKRNISRLK